MSARAMKTGARLRDALIEAQRRVLERIATGAPLEEILDLLAQLVEEQAGGMRCSILLVDATRQRLRFAAGPSLSPDYRREMEPYLRIAPDGCACAAATYTRQPVHTRDVASDPLWHGCADVAVRNGMRAVWSTPILSSDGVVLGTFALGYTEPRLPTMDHVRLIEMATQLARIAVETRAHAVLRTAFEGAPNGVAIVSPEGIVLRANRAFADVTGHEVCDLIGRSIGDFAPSDSHDRVLRRLQSFHSRELLHHQKYRARDGSRVGVRERCWIQRDAGGGVSYVVYRIEKVLDAANDPLERLSRRELEVLELVAAGHTSKAIGTRLHIAPTSVDTYRSRLMVKLGLPGVAGLVRFAVENGVAAA